MSQAYEVFSRGTADQVLLSCEHASNALPSPWRWPAQDAWLVDTHWAWDPGAADLCRELAERLQTTAVLSCFSRLLADPNRPPDSPELFRREAEGRVVELNRVIDEHERRRRLIETYERYHAALDRETARAAAPLLFSVHTFTPVYAGVPRAVELGVLFDQAEDLGLALTAHLAGQGYDARANEPYSGKLGLIYSVERPAANHGRRALELEVRQDLATDAAFRARLVPVLATWLQQAAIAAGG